MFLCFSFFCFISDFLPQNTPWGCAYVIFGIPGMIKSSSFFFLKAGSSAVIILRVFTIPLSFFFFFCSSFTAQQSNASVSFCVYVCVSARSCLSFCDIRRFPRFCSKWFTNGDKLTSVFFFCTCRRLGMNCTALLHERKEGTKNEVRAPSSVLKRQWSSSVLHDGYEMIEAAYSLFSFFQQSKLRHLLLS